MHLLLNRATGRTRHHRGGVKSLTDSNGATNRAWQGVQEVQLELYTLPVVEGLVDVVLDPVDAGGHVSRAAQGHRLHLRREPEGHAQAVRQNQRAIGQVDLVVCRQRRCTVQRERLVRTIEGEPVVRRADVRLGLWTNQRVRQPEVGDCRLRHRMGPEERQVEPPVVVVRRPPGQTRRDEVRPRTGQWTAGADRQVSVPRVVWAPVLVMPALLGEARVLVREVAEVPATELRHQVLGTDRQRALRLLAGDPLVAVLEGSPTLRLFLLDEALRDVVHVRGRSAVCRWRPTGAGVDAEGEGDLVGRRGIAVRGRAAGCAGRVDWRHHDGGAEYNNRGEQREHPIPGC